MKKVLNGIKKKYQLLLKSTNQLAEGHLDLPIEGDVGIFRPVQDELKKIQSGFKKAVDEEVKNERMKTELVTNVSHDLRTPLTAIITYIDLLKNEKDEEKRKEYTEVLERKSLRLKALIEDLFEMSKAASKTIQMNYMKVDLVGLIRQAELENEEKIQEAHLEFRWKLPESKVVLWLDSEKTAYGTVNDDFYSNGYYSSIYYNAAIDEGNSNDLFVSIAWSCAGIRFTLEVGESPHN